MSQPTVTQVLDDRSDGITFFSSSASWNHESNPLEFNQTATWTQTAGDSLSIPFNGTSISVFATLDGTDFPPVQTSYELDDIPAVIQTNSSFLAQTQFQQKFYESPVLDPGVHTLTITNLANGSTFRFDFVKVTSPNPAFQTAIVPPSLTPTTTSFSAAPTQDSSSSSDATDSTDSTDSVSIVGPMTLQEQTSSLPTSTLDTTTSTTTGTASNSDANTSSTAVSASGGTGNGAHLAAILGGILGGVGFLVWIVVFLLIQRRRRQRINRTRRMSEFLRRSSEKRTYQSNFTPVRRHDSQDMSSFGTPDPLVPNYVTTSDSSSTSASVMEGRAPPASRYELTPFTGEPTPEIERLPPERSAWSPEPPGRREGKKRGYFYVDSPPKYNSGQFYHLES